MNEDIRWLIDTMRANARGYWVAAADPALLTNLFKLFTLRDGVSTGLQRILRSPKQVLGPERFADVIERRLASPRTFEEHASWIIFWSIVEACDNVSQSAKQTDHEPELNGQLLQAIETSCRRFRPPAGDPRSSDCVAVAILNLAKLDNEALTGADFGLAVEIETTQRKMYLVTHIQAKRAKGLSVNINRAAGTSTQLRRLAARNYGRYLFYNQHGEPSGLYPTTMSAELVRTLSKDGTKAVNPVHLADDFAASLAVALTSGATAARRPSGGLPPSDHGYAYVESMGEAVDLLFPVDEPDLAVSKLLVVRVGERRYSIADVQEMQRLWEMAAAERASRANHAKLLDSDQHNGQGELPPITG